MFREPVLSAHDSRRTRREISRVARRFIPFIAFGGRQGDRVSLHVVAIYISISRLHCEHVRYRRKNEVIFVYLLNVNKRGGLTPLINTT